MFHFSGEGIVGIAVVAGCVVLYFRTVKDLKRERREGIELKKEVSELPWDSSKLGGSRSRCRRSSCPRGAGTFSLIPAPLTVAFDPRGATVKWLKNKDTACCKKG